MPPTQDLRASDADREATVERLRVAAMEGRIDAEELEERLTAAYGARWCSELSSLTADVTPPPAQVRRPAPATFAGQRRRTNGLAVASLIASLCVWIGPGAALAAIVLGHMALARIYRSAGTQKGRGFAFTGLTLGYLEILAMALWILAGVTWWG